MEHPRYCGSCGTSVSGQENFCTACGSPLVQENKAGGPGMSTDQSVESQAPAPKTLTRSAILIPIGALLVVLVVALGYFLGGSSERQAERCFSESGHTSLARQTADGISAMTRDLNRASDAATAAALREAGTRLNVEHGPAFIRLGQRWLSLPDCGDAQVKRYGNMIGEDLISLGSILRDFEFPNFSTLERGISIMERIGSTTGRLVDHLDSR